MIGLSFHRCGSATHQSVSIQKGSLMCRCSLCHTEGHFQVYGMKGGSKVYMCLHDLQKGFNWFDGAASYHVLLKNLFVAGVNGKMWRVWRNGMKVVKLDGRLCDCFPVSRGVRQGLVLSPTLFLLVINPLLRDLQTSGVGLSINSFYAGGRGVGGFLHADDIWTLASSETSLMKQFDNGCSKGWSMDVAIHGCSDPWM